VKQHGEAANTILHVTTVMLFMQAVLMLTLVPHLQQQLLSVSLVWRQWLVSRRASFCADSVIIALVSHWPDLFSMRIKAG
jgi:hypothetical protein